jgi:valyl-tRNA synthetase
MIKPSSSIIVSTLNYPKDHEFKEGKPDVEEKIIKIKPVYSKIGPSLKKNAQKIIKNVQANQDEIIKKIETNGDISLSEFYPAGSKNEFIIKDGYFQIEKEVKVKGKKDSKIITFDDFYLEIKN